MGTLKATQTSKRRETRRQETVAQELRAVQETIQKERRELALQLAMTGNPANFALSMRGVSKGYTRNATVLAAKHGKLLIEYASHGRAQDVQRMLDSPEFKLQSNSPQKYVSILRNVGSRAFVAACEKHHMDVVRILMRAATEPVPRVDPTVSEDIALRIACRDGNVELFHMLMGWRGADGRRVNPATMNNTCMSLACAAKSPEIVAGLLADERVNPTVEQEPIRIAVETEQSDIVEMLLQWKSPNPREFVDPRYQGNLLFMIAVSRHQPGIVRSLLAWRHTIDDEVLFVDPTVNDNYAIKKADAKGYVSIENMLLDWEGPNGERVVYP
jgi:hypothetical protein